MKYLIALLLACNLGALIGFAINAAARDVKASAPVCKSRLIL